MQLLKQTVVRIAPITDVEAAGLHQPAQLRALRGVAGGDRHVDGPLPQDRKRDVHLGRPMLGVLPQGPRHAWQGRQEAAIHGGQLGQRGLLRDGHVRPELRPQRRQHLMHQRRVKDLGRFTEGSQGGAADTQALLHRGQGRGLLEAAQTGHGRVEKIQQQQGGVLIVEQEAIPSAVPLRRGEVEVVKERAEQAKIFEPLEGLLGQRGREAESHVNVLLS